MQDSNACSRKKGKISHADGSGGSVSVNNNTSANVDVKTTERKPMKIIFSDYYAHSVSP